MYLYDRNIYEQVTIPVNQVLMQDIPPLIISPSVIISPPVSRHLWRRWPQMVMMGMTTMIWAWST